MASQAQGTTALPPRSAGPPGPVRVTRVVPAGARGGLPPGAHLCPGTSPPTGRVVSGFIRLLPPRLPSPPRPGPAAEAQPAALWAWPSGPAPADRPRGNGNDTELPAQTSLPSPSPGTSRPHTHTLITIVTASTVLVTAALSLGSVKCFFVFKPSLSPLPRLTLLKSPGDGLAT